MSFYRLYHYKNIVLSLHKYRFIVAFYRFIVVHINLDKVLTVHVHPLNVHVTLLHLCNLYEIQSILYNQIAISFNKNI